jgi:hypothetical protein
MKFGELKSKIETYLTESYKKGTLKDNVFVFEQLVLKNKSISKIFFLYDELSDKKGMNESVATEFIHESVTAYENLVNKVTPKQVSEIKAWVGHVQCENKYQDIDNLFSTNILTLENKIKSKKIILESIKSKKEDQKEIINVPINSMVKVANKTVENYISSLNESERKELKKILSTPKETLVEDYNSQKESVISKLSEQKDNENDKEVVNTIEEVLNKLQTESFSELNYFKLKQLNEGL